MGYEYEIIDGERVEVHAAAAFHQMDAAFRQAFGFGLHVSSGVRTREEQAYLYDQYLHHGGNLAAAPGYSNHEEDGPVGPRAMDIRDEGDDPGVTRRGTTRDRWMQDNAAMFGFTNAGYNFSQVEAWHKEFQGTIGGSAGAGGGGGASTYAASVRDIQDLANKLGANLAVDGDYGPATTGWVRVFQGDHGLDTDGIVGPLTWAKMNEVYSASQAAPQLAVDGNWGQATTTALQKRVGATADGVLGQDTWSKVQAAVGATVDGSPGPDTYRHLQAAIGLTGSDIDGEFGQKSVEALQRFLNTGATFHNVLDATPAPPAGGGSSLPASVPYSNQSARPSAEIDAFLKSRNLTVDKAGVIAFQASQGIDADGIWGNASDGLAFPPAGSVHGVDYSFARPAPATLQSRGVKFAMRYLAPITNGKGVTKDEYDSLRAVGLQVPLIYEEDGHELTGGYLAGIAVAQKAETHRVRVGLPASVVFFNVDFDAGQSDLASIEQALRGVATVIGKSRVGLYAGYNVIKAMFDRGVIAWGFQTYAWSGGKWDDRAQFQQWANGQWNDTVDFTRARDAAALAGAVADQTVVTPTPTPDPDPTPTPDPDPTPTPEPTPTTTITVDRDWLLNLYENMKSDLEEVGKKLDLG